MDVYHKILSRIYELSAGADSTEVDLSDLLKKEGFYSNIDGISQHLLTESWVTETRPRVVKITHWGAAEAKRVLANKPDNKLAASREAKRLLAEARELVIMLEEFAGAPNEEKLGGVRKKHEQMSGIMDRLDGVL